MAARLLIKWRQLWEASTALAPGSGREASAQRAPRLPTSSMPHNACKATRRPARRATTLPVAPLQANFDSLQALIDRIHRDAQVAEEALEDDRYRHHAKDPFLLPPAQQAATVQPAEGGPAKAGDGSA